MGAATRGLSRVEVTMSVPKRRNTAATIAITIGMGMAAMARRTTPLIPSARIRSPAVKNAPTTSANDKCCKDGPRRTVPGIDQAKPSGRRYTSDITNVARPADRKIPKTQDASWASVRPPAAPTAKVTAIGPDAEKTNPITPLAAYSAPTSRITSRTPAGRTSGRSSSGLRSGVFEGVGWVVTDMGRSASVDRVPYSPPTFSSCSSRGRGPADPGYAIPRIDRTRLRPSSWPERC